MELLKQQYQNLTSAVDSYVATQSNLNEAYKGLDDYDYDMDEIWGKPFYAKGGIGLEDEDGQKREADKPNPDSPTIDYMKNGGHGCISVTCNVAPGPLANLHRAWQSGDLDTVREINDRLLPLHNALFCETSPGPVKYAAHLLGMCSADARLPICEIAEESKSKVQAAMRHAGLIN